MESLSASLSLTRSFELGRCRSSTDPNRFSGIFHKF